MRHPIGRNIVEVCELIEHIGPCNTRKVSQSMRDMSSTLARQYCSRAVNHGFLIADDSTQPLYSVAPGWRAMLEQCGIRKARAPVVRPIKEVVPKPRSLPPIGVRNSIFDVRV